MVCSPPPISTSRRVSTRVSFPFFKNASHSPIIEKKCATCHQPGGIGPMPLNNYAQIKGFSAMIRGFGSTPSPIGCRPMCSTPPAMATS